MKLDRNINPDGRGKYALIHMRKLTDQQAGRVDAFAGAPELEINVPSQAVSTGRDGQFFVIKYKDRFAEPALRAYAQAVRESARYAEGDRSGLYEYAAEIDREADIAGQMEDRMPD